MLLLDIKTHLSNIFGKELKKITLDLFNDPDEDEQWLNVNVYTSLPPAKAVERLNRFDEEWWHRVDNEAKYLINVDVRF
jgi:hypothetical protein